MNFLKNLRLRKFPACLNHSGEISPTTEFGDNVDIAIIPVEIHLDITRAELLNPCPQIHRAATGVLIDIDQQKYNKQCLHKWNLVLRTQLKNFSMGKKRTFE